MPREKAPASAGITVGIIVGLIVIAAMMASHFTYEAGPKLAKTWPALFLAVGAWFVMGSLLEMGLGIIALSGLWLAHNMDYVNFWKMWPFLILLVALLVGVGFIRARASGDK